jgi:hypothetical protein
MGQQIDQTLKSFAQAFPEGAQFFAQASELIKQGIASGIQAQGGAEPPTTSPTSLGGEFPGGGHSSSPRPGR